MIKLRKKRQKGITVHAIFKENHVSTLMKETIMEQEMKNRKPFRRKNKSCFEKKTY